MTGEAQSTLFEGPGMTAPESSPARVRALAGILAGFAWPGLDYSRLGHRRLARAEQAARQALQSLADAE